MTLLTKKQSYRLTLLWVGFTFVISLLCAISLYSYQYNKEKQVYFSAQEAKLNAASLVLYRENETLKNVTLLFFQQLQNIAKLNPTADLNNIFAGLASVYPNILQVRWIANNGLEKIRIDVRNHEVDVTPKSALQNKSHRYYFQQGISLNAGEVYISEIDLNVEKNQVVVPYTPTLRGVTKGSINSLGDGVLVINFNMAPVLNNLSTENSSQTTLLLGNQKRWLVHPDNAKLWAPDLRIRPASIVLDKPQLWQHIKNGQKQVVVNDRFYNVKKIDFYSNAEKNLYLVAQSAPNNYYDVKRSASLWASIVGVLIFLTGSLISIYTLRQHHKLERLSAMLSNEKNDLKNALDEREKLIDELAEAKKLSSLSLMVAGVAHEINTPVGATKMATTEHQRQLDMLSDAMQSGLTKTQLSDYISNAKKALNLSEHNISRAAELIKQFKRMSIERGREKVELFSVNQSVKDLLDSMSGIFKHHHVYVQHIASQDFQISGFPGVFSQIIQSLITNAIDHGFKTVNTQRRITITVYRKDVLYVSVKDNGSGIKQENISSLFDPFYTTKRHDGHTGLGLHFVKLWIDQAFNGSVSVTSQLDQGTEFLLTFSSSPSVVQDDDCDTV